MKVPKSALLFAAGFGTRMAPLTDMIPKPLVKVAGETLLDHTLKLCEDVPLTKRVINTHYRAEQIAHHVATHYPASKIRVLHETPEILETGGGLRNAMPQLGPGPVFTLNTDAIWSGPNPLDMLLSYWDPARMDALLACVPLEQALGHRGKGDFSLGADGRLVRGGPLIFGGIQIINPTGIEDIEETAFSLNLLWNQMAEQGRLCGIAYPGQWCDVGQPSSIPLAESLVADV